MNVSATADTLPPERLLVAIETPGEEIKKGRAGKKFAFSFFFEVTCKNMMYFAHLEKK